MTKFMIWFLAITLALLLSFILGTEAVAGVNFGMDTTSSPIEKEKMFTLTNHLESILKASAQAIRDKKMGGSILDDLDSIEPTGEALLKGHFQIRQDWKKLFISIRDGRVEGAQWRLELIVKNVNASSPIDQDKLDEIRLKRKEFKAMAKKLSLDLRYANEQAIILSEVLMQKYKKEGRLLVTEELALEWEDVFKLIKEVQYNEADTHLQAIVYASSPVDLNEFPPIANEVEALMKVNRADITHKSLSVDVRSGFIALKMDARLIVSKDENLKENWEMVFTLIDEGELERAFNQLDLVMVSIGAGKKYTSSPVKYTLVDLKYRRDAIESLIKMIGDRNVLSPEDMSVVHSVTANLPELISIEMLLAEGEIKQAKERLQSLIPVGADMFSSSRPLTKKELLLWKN